MVNNTYLFIYPYEKPPTQSAPDLNHNKCFAEFRGLSYKYKEDLMGWTGNLNTKSQVKLMFNSYDDAISYATSKGYQYKIQKPYPHKPSLGKVKSYSDNFK